MSINHCPFGIKHFGSAEAINEKNCIRCSTNINKIVFDGKTPNRKWSLTHYWDGDGDGEEDKKWALRKNLSNIYERVYIMGIKHKRLTEDMQEQLLSRIENREWESITPTEQLMEVEEEPSNNAPSPSAPNPRRNKRKRSETSGGSSSSSKKVKATDGSSR